MSRCGGLGPFGEVAVLEADAGPDEGDEVRCGDREPAGPGGLDELEYHRRRCGRAAGPAGDLILNLTVLKVLSSPSSESSVRVAAGIAGRLQR